MATTSHKNAPASQRHAPYSWVVDNEAARLALSPSLADMHKHLLQDDDKSEWLLIGVAPAVWKSLGSAGGLTEEQAMQLAFLVQNVKSSTLFTAPVISRVESFNFLENNSLALFYFQYSTAVPGYRADLYSFVESIDVNWGDGTSGTLERVCETYGNVSGYDPNTGEYNPLHIFPGPGTYTLTFQGRNVYGLGNVFSYELTVS